MAGTPAPAEPAPAAPAADAPDWLNEMAGTPAPAEPAPAAPAADAPDWLNEMAGTPAPAEPAPAAPAADAPDWLNEMAGTPAPPAPAPAAPAEPAMSADWLDALTAPTPASPASSAPSQSADDMMGLLDGLDLGTGVDMPAQGIASSSEDLLGLTDDLSLAAPAEKAAAEEPADLDFAASLADGEMPDWMRELGPAGRPGGDMDTSASTSPELMAQIGDLRFDKIFGGESKASGPEKVGALKDVVNTLRSELIFAGVSLKPGEVLLDQPLTTDQQKRIGLIEQILKVEAEGVSIAKGREGLPITRWLVSLLLIAAVAVPMFVSLPLPLDSAPAPDVLSTHDALAALPQNASVLVAFEYEPDSSAELQPLALALMSDLAARTDVHIYTISTHLAGAAMADRVFDKLIAASPGGGQASGQIQQDATPKIAAGAWTNLGYLPGGPSGVTALTSGGPEGAASAFALDAYGHSTGLGNASLTSLKPAAIIVLASRADDVRMWVEQAGKPTGIPIIAATSQSASPMASPYRQSGQLLAHLTGTLDAARYAALSQTPGAAAGLLNMQVTGTLAAILLLVVGSILYGLRALRERQR
jgi:hypothetical protein